MWQIEGKNQEMASCRLGNYLNFFHAVQRFGGFLERRLVGWSWGRRQEVVLVGDLQKYELWIRRYWGCGWIRLWRQRSEFLKVFALWCYWPLEVPRGQCSAGRARSVTEKRVYGNQGWSREEERKGAGAIVVGEGSLAIGSTPVADSQG